MNEKSIYTKNAFKLLSIEFFERFSFYGMKSIMFLIMAKHLLMSNQFSSEFYLQLISFTLLCTLLGGILIDLGLNRKKMIIVGIVISLLSILLIVIFLLYDFSFQIGFFLFFGSTGFQRINIIIELGKNLKQSKNLSLGFTVYIMIVTLSSILSGLIVENFSSENYYITFLIICFVNGLINLALIKSHKYNTNISISQHKIQTKKILYLITIFSVISIVLLAKKLNIINSITLLMLFIIIFISGLRFKLINKTQLIEFIFLSLLLQIIYTILDIEYHYMYFNNFFINHNLISIISSEFIGPLSLLIFGGITLLICIALKIKYEKFNDFKRIGMGMTILTFSIFCISYSQFHPSIVISTITSLLGFGITEILIPPIILSLIFKRIRSELIGTIMAIYLSLYQTLDPITSKFTSHILHDTNSQYLVPTYGLIICAISSIIFIIVFSLRSKIRFS